MEKTEETVMLYRQKVIIGVIIGALLIGGLLLFLWRYSSVLSGMSQQVVKNPLQQNAVSVTQIKEEYEADFSKVINDYLLLDANATDFSLSTSRVKDKLLALKVPSIYKESHLSTILALSSIEASLAKGDSSGVNEALSELRKIDQEFITAGSR